jgi:hypothetical protein
MTRVKDWIYWRDRYKKLELRYTKLQSKYFRLKSMMIQGKPLRETQFEKMHQTDYKKKYLNLLAKYKKLRAKQG